MGSGLILGPVIVVLLVLGGLFVAFVLVPWRRERQAKDDEILSGPSLTWRPRPGQDPIAVVTRLELEGISATTTVDLAESVVVVPLGEEGDRAAFRERVRTVIAQAPLNLEGDPAPGDVVRFEDESTT